MTCYSPLHAYEGRVKDNGKLELAWNLRDSAEGVRLDLPCGCCIGCRLDRARHWAVRCMHEASLHADNCFVTLTFNDKHLPLNRSLDVSLFQDFMRRLRKQYVPKGTLAGDGIRFYHAGEYGGKLGRPHYHVLLFNHDFPDRILLKETPAGSRIDTSESLEKLWPFGFSSVGNVTFASAAYVARYTMKKVKPSKADEHYVNTFTGEVLKPEYTTMSRRPGIAAGWFDRFSSDVYPSDEVVVNGFKIRPPRFYDKLLDESDPDLLDSLKVVRRSRMDGFENSSARLMVKEECKLASIKSLRRSL